MNYQDFSMFEQGSRPEDLETSFGRQEAAGAAASSGGNPYVIAGMVGLKALEAHKKRKELERQERYQAQVSVTGRTQSALAPLSNIGTALKL